LKVLILTYCREPKLLPGTRLVFRTIRTGFPTAKIVVVDNASVPDVRSLLRADAEGVGAEYQQLYREIAHSRFLRAAIDAALDEPLIFIDPDVCFWKDCETWSFERPLAGRVLPRFAEPFTGCIAEPRPHSSFLWISSPSRLRELFLEMTARYRDSDPIEPRMLAIDSVWHRWDTFAAFHGARPDAVQAFSPAQLDHYDHLFCGSHLDLLLPTLDAEEREFMARVHAEAASSHTRLRGLWRLQQAFFESRRIPGDATAPPRASASPA
jgi:hypothetical protein